MRSLTYRITTLGCRVNHAESREIESVLRSRGLLPAGRDDAADLEIIHTCSVTNTAAAKSRHAIRRARRGQQPPEADPRRASRLSVHIHPEVFVTGCFAGTDPTDAAELAGTSGHIVPHHADDHSLLIDRFTAHLERWLASRGRQTSSLRDTSQKGSDRFAHADAQSAPLPLPVIPPRRRAGRHVRAELRIQDGCDAHCTFCILPRIRPTLRSKPIADVVDEARRLVDLGHREIVLTGIFIGAYGHETALRRRQRNRFASPLADLLDAVAQIPGLQRLRLSSMEPGDADQPLLDAMVANLPVVVPHLHLPLQSGADAILRRMNRQYRIGDYLNMIDQVNDALTIDQLPPAITTDIICGFPGETDEHFAHTIAIARRVGYLHMHVFPFSPKKGTAAARWRSQFVDPATVKARVRALIDLENDPEDGLAIRYRRRLEGREVRVILEQPDRRRPGVMMGRCDHYARVAVRTGRARGTLVRCRIERVTSEHLTAAPVRAGVPLPVMS